MKSSKVFAFLRRWSSRLHIYVGLYLLLFLWLFAISGLLLNHPKWEFASFWPTRQQSTLERAVQMPDAGDDTARARDLMRQLDLRGEILWRETRPADNTFRFRVHRPGQQHDVSVDLAEQHATVQQVRVNAWGAIRALHLFTGVKINDANNHRDWWLTHLWSFAMDATSVGMILLVITGVHIWLSLRQKRIAGALALLAGCLACGVFLFVFG
jgi:hypothetical protein